MSRVCLISFSSLHKIYSRNQFILRNDAKRKMKIGGEITLQDELKKATIHLAAFFLFKSGDYKMFYS